MNWLYYLGEANLYLSIFYLAYHIFLAKETYNQLNRVYLLFSCVAAFVLPVLQLGILKPAEPLASVSYLATSAVFESLPVTTSSAAIVPVTTAHHLSWPDYLIYAYAIGCGILLLMLVVKLFVLIKLMHGTKRGRQDNYKIIYLPESDVAFSFFNYLFIGTDAAGSGTIIRHELVHINQKHSLDILFLELLKIINWFNPFIYLLQNSLKTIHEYIADEQTAALETDPISYSAFLVNNAYGAGGSSVTHSFFNYNLLKKRIIMLNQQRSGSSARLKYLMAAPLCAGLLCASTLAFSKDYGFIDLDPARVAIVPAIAPAAQQQPANKPNQKLPPPTILLDSYKKFNEHLATSVRYGRTVKSTQSALVIVTFSVTASHKIADAAIEKSGGNAFDAIVMHAFKTYDGDVADNPGNRKFIFNFYGYDHKDISAPNPGGYKVVGNMVIVPPVVKFPPPRPSKLIVVDGKIHSPQPEESISADSVTDVPANTDWAIKKWGDRAKYGVKIYSGHAQITKKSAARLTHTDKTGNRAGKSKLHNAQVPYDPDLTFVINGKKQIFDQSQIKAKTLVVINCDSLTMYQKGDAYARTKWGNDVGKVAVLHGAHASVKLFNWPQTAAKTDVATPGSAISRDSILKIYGQFEKSLADVIKYHKEDKINSVQGRVIAVFSVNNDGDLQYLKIVRSVSDAASEEVFNAIKNSPFLKKLKGNWTQPVTFSLAREMPDGSLKDIKSQHDIRFGVDGATYEYNPQNVALIEGNSISFNDVVIRGYLKKS